MKKRLRVLLIEDSEFDGKMLIALLRGGGYEVESLRVQNADSMRAALASAKWDIIFSDHEMPEFNAPSALNVLKDSQLDIPFIIVSGGIGEETAVGLMKAGAHDYLVKGQYGRLLPAVDREVREAKHRAGLRAAEESLRQSELRYRLLWENAPDVVIVASLDGGIVYANTTAKDMLGYGPQELEGRSLADLYPDGTSAGQRQAGIHCRWRPGARYQARQISETRIQRKDGTSFPAEIAFSEMELEGRWCFVAFIRDVTARKDAERALAEHAEQMHLAREIQQGLFPKSSPKMPGLEIAGASFPAEATGGDYFDYLTMTREGVGIVIGDVTGHGLGPALLMAETRAYLRVVAMNRDAPQDILTRVNRVLAEDVGRERFVTVLLARLDPAERRLTFSNAGHPAGYVIADDGHVRHKLSRTGPPLGFKAAATFFDAPVIDLHPGDIVLFLTDGFEESLSPAEEFYGLERLLDFVRANRTLSAAEIVQRVYKAARDFTQGAPQADDLTCVVLKVLT